MRCLAHRLVVAFAILGLGSLPVASAAIFTWSGGTDSDWNDAANWDTLPVPAIDADLIFTGLTPSNLPTNNDFGAASQFGSLTFNGNYTGPLAIGGNAFNLQTGVTQNNTALVSFTQAITMTAGQTWDIGSGGLTMDGALNGDFNVDKTGAGTLTLNAASARAVAAATTSVSGGILRVRNNTALGSHATANTIPVTVNSAILELNNGITLDNGLSVTLNNGATVRSDGTNATNARLNVSTAVSANNVTISTVGAGDVFTIGNGANDVSGGNGTDDTIFISGPGTVRLATTNNYIGNWQLDSGTTQLGAAAALGATAARTVTLNGGTLSGRLAGATTFTANPIVVTANSAIHSDLSSGTAGVTYTFGTLSIGTNTLNVTTAATATSGTGGGYRGSYGFIWRFHL